MKHEWELGWKEIKGGFVDVCRKCGVGRYTSWKSSYIPPKEVQKFLTTYSPVTFERYIPCAGGK